MNINKGKIMSIDKHFPKILELLSSDEYITSKKISEILKISEKTARVKLNQLSEIIKENGANI